MGSQRYLTPAQRAGLARRRTEKAQTFLRSAKLLHAQKDWEGAISRAYYAVFHRLLAQAISQGIADPLTRHEHGQVADLAGTLVTDEIIVESPINGMRLPHTPKSAYFNLKGQREAADYYVGKVGKNQAEISLEIAGSFFSQMERI